MYEKKQENYRLDEPHHSLPSPLPHTAPAHSMPNLPTYLPTDGPPKKPNLTNLNLNLDLNLNLNLNLTLQQWGSGEATLMSWAWVGGTCSPPMGVSQREGTLSEIIDLNLNLNPKPKLKPKPVEVAQPP